VPIGGTLNRFTSAVLEDGPHAGHYTAKLTIDKVTKEDQESDNVLLVQNDLGETQYKFSLGVGERPPVAGSNLDAGVPSIDEASSGPVIAIVIVALIIVIVIVVAVVARAQGILCFADKNVGDDNEKSAAQFEALEKGDPSPEKEMIKEPLTEVKKAAEAEPVLVATTPATPANEAGNAEKEEKRSNGAHTPV
jgi:hypothetical protein